jgi:hypothetical protein
MPSYDGLLHHFVRKWQLVGELLKLEAAVKILDIKTSGVDVSRRQPLLNLRNRLMDSHTSKLKGARLEMTRHDTGDDVLSSSVLYSEL